MTTFLSILCLVLAAAAGLFYILWHRTKAAVARADTAAVAAKAELESEVAAARKALEVQIQSMQAEVDRVAEHYQREAGQALEASEARIKELAIEAESLRRFAHLGDAEAAVKSELEAALAEAESLRMEAAGVVEETKRATSEERQIAQRRSEELRRQAEAVLVQASRDAAKTLAAAEQQARELAGDAYAALQEKAVLERAAKAIENVLHGYGDRYVVPTRSMLDELASDFGHTAAGEALVTARNRSRQLVELGEAATCDYVEAGRRETAIRFVIDAFNGRVDAILSTVKHNNHGTLEQRIKDTFATVNLHGQAFRSARILPTYLEARLEELRWAVVAQELRLKEREEQRAIQERIREEEKARREYERAMQEAAREEENLKRALEKAREEAAHATAQERARFEAQVEQLTRRLEEAEARGQRALSMAQQTRAGHIYIISNIGSFGEEVFKIGMTRRLEPLDRVWELSDASVPFDFDVHAIIRSEDAPALENALHTAFDEFRVNKVNYRKEFFRIPLARIRELTEQRGIEATFTLLAEAREYRETLALEKMTPEQREQHHMVPAHQPEESDALE